MGASSSSNSLYQYYTQGGIQSGLSADQPYLTLNGRNFTLYGTQFGYNKMSFFKWNDYLQRARACGFNTITTAIPWHYHQPERECLWGVQNFTDLIAFIHTVQMNDMFLVPLIGPYTDNFHDFGGLPAWLLNETEQRVRMRTTDRTFMEPASKYLYALLSILMLFQFTWGGPIIAVQLENNYGVFNFNNTDYMTGLARIVRNARISELLYTVDDPVSQGTAGSTSGTLQTILTAQNSHDVTAQMDALEKLQPNKSIMVMKYIPGPDDYWAETKLYIDMDQYRTNIETILKRGASFVVTPLSTAQANLNEGAYVSVQDQTYLNYKPNTCIIKPEALLRQNGSYTLMYNITKELLQQYSTVPTTANVPMPPPFSTIIYPTAQLYDFLPTTYILNNLVPDNNVVFINQPLPMEAIRWPDGKSQSYGFLAYQANYTVGSGTSILNITFNYQFLEIVYVFVNDTLIGPTKLKTTSDVDNPGFWTQATSSFVVNSPNSGIALVTFLFENLGRAAFTPTRSLYDRENRGLLSPPQINNDVIVNFRCVKMDFSGTAWRPILGAFWQTAPNRTGDLRPGMYRFYVDVTAERIKSQTYLDMSAWSKGVVFVGTTIIGRYMSVGPIKTLFVSNMTWGRTGQRPVIVFEQFTSNMELVFTDEHKFGLNY